MKPGREAAWDALLRALPDDDDPNAPRVADILAEHRPLIEATRGCIVHGRAPDEMVDGHCPDCTDGYVLVRAGTGGVMEDGFTNHLPIDYSAPPVVTEAESGEPNGREFVTLLFVIDEVRPPTGRPRGWLQGFEAGRRAAREAVDRQFETSGFDAKVRQDFEEMAERIHDAFWDHDADVDAWDRDMAAALTRRGYAIVSARTVGL